MRVEKLVDPLKTGYFDSSRGSAKNRSFWARAIVSIGMCALLLWLINWHELGEKLRAASGYWLFMVFATIHADRAFMAYKWMVLLRGVGVPVSIGTALKAYYVASFWDSFLPSSVGSDIVRIGWLMKKVKGSTVVISSVLIERLFGIMALAVVALGSLALLPQYLEMKVPALFRIVLLVLFVSGLALTVLFSRSAHAIFHKLLLRFPFQRVSHAIEKVGIAALAFKEKPRLLIAFLGLSIFEQAFPILSTFALAKSFSIDLPLSWVIIGVPAILIVSRMPISVNSLGIKESAYAFVFSFAGIPLSESVMMSVIDRMLLLLSALPGALWMVSSSKHNAPASIIVPASNTLDGK